MTRLELHGNGIPELVEGLFSRLSALNNLELDSNKLSFLEVKLYAWLSALTYLALYETHGCSSTPWLHFACCPAWRCYATSYCNGNLLKQMQ